MNTFLNSAGRRNEVPSRVHVRRVHVNVGNRTYKAGSLWRLAKKKLISASQDSSHANVMVSAEIGGMPGTCAIDATGMQTNLAELSDAGEGRGGPAKVPISVSFAARKPMRLQDTLFGILLLALLVMLAFQIGAVVLALVGAFACGAI